MLFKIVLLFYGSIFYGDPRSNSLQYFSAINTQQDFKKNIFLRSNHLADQEKGNMMSLFWNFIQNGLKGIYEENNINLLNNNLQLRKRIRQVDEIVFLIQPSYYYFSQLETNANVENVVRILADVVLRQLYNSTESKQRIIFGSERK